MVWDGLVDGSFFYVDGVDWVGMRAVLRVLLLLLFVVFDFWFEGFCCRDVLMLKQSVVLVFLNPEKSCPLGRGWMESFLYVSY